MRAVSSAFSRPSHLLGTPSNYIARENSGREINAFKKLHELRTAQRVKSPVTNSSYNLPSVNVDTHLKNLSHNDKNWQL